MKIWLEERIGEPDLFTGRKKELAFFLRWIDRIQRRISQSTAILSRRKTGKTALMERLYNLTFQQNGRVVPFYFEIRETDQWLGDFCEEFFFTFLYQFMAFVTRKQEYLDTARIGSYGEALKNAEREGLDYLCDLLRKAEIFAAEEKTDHLWNMVRDAPRMTALHYNLFVVQMIDEFQFINRFIFWDKERTRRAHNLAGSYLRTCEYKSAPLLVSGSWVGWLMNDLNRLLPGRFIKKPLGNMPEDEIAEMIFRYSLSENMPVTEEIAWLIAQLTEGSPFYINALFRSVFEEKDLSTEAGVQRTLEYETLNLDGSINTTWMEYIDSAFPRINEKYAKDIVLYLSKHRDRRVGHRELKEKLGLEMSDPELEKKLKAIFRSDIIEEDQGLYRGVRDNIFDKVFRRSYADDIHHFVTREAPDEYRALFNEISERYGRLRGDHNRYKGAFAEFMIIHRLIHDVRKEGELFKSLMGNLPDDFVYVEYGEVRSCHSPPLHEPEFQIDVLARAEGDGYSLIGEVKNRKAKFSVKEAGEFREKAGELMKLENVDKAVLFVFSVSGFFKNTLAYLKKHGIAWTSDKRWLEKP
ncbi:MAG: hypothetical protein DRI57_19400 [Deltaproteobacteria bacterium]|nr:MAG: hypothetical protein DRI57_19400 [Deltaproteobacteria bacterium]